MVTIECSPSSPLVSSANTTPGCCSGALERRTRPHGYYAYLASGLVQIAAMSTLLTTATVAAYVKEHLRGIDDLPIDLDAELAALEIADGNLNYAWHVHEVGSPSRAVFVKQAPGFIKCLGPEFELSAQRAVFESAVLQEFHRLAPSHTPRHLLLDEVRGALTKVEIPAASRVRAL